MQVYSFAQIVQLTILDLWGRIVAILPDLIGAIIILIFGFIVAPLVGGVVKKLIDVIKVDVLSEKLGVNDLFQGYTDKFSISTLIGKLVKWFFILAFTMAAAEVLGWNRITLFLNEIIFYIPQVLVAVIILALSLIAGKFFQTIVVRSIIGSNTPVDRPEVLGSMTKWAFVIFGILAALIQLGIATSLIQILFTGIVFALALAFGLGGRKKVEEMLDKIDSPIKKKKSIK
ncbi:MAG: hypothetical protein RLY43_843 [Bacteroidota bacterium]|jgi:hypothetical protein